MIYFAQTNDVVYERIYEALPNCRNCTCASMSDFQ
jgi:hypothetical protein